MLTRAFLCRHGDPEESIRGRICGALDVGLSRTGRKQAQGLAAALAPASLAAVYSSPQRRAVETASAIAAACRLAPVELEALREIDFGVFEGLTYDEAAARYPDVYREWMENPARARFPGGETYEDLRARVSEALDEILRRHEGRAFTVVAHGGVIRTVLAISLEVPNGAIFRLDQGYGCVSVVDWLDGAPVVRLINVDAVPTTGGSPLSRLYSTA